MLSHSIRIASGIVLTLALAACQVPEPPQHAQIRVLHALPGGPDIDVAIDGERVASQLEYAGATALFEREAGEAQVVVTVAGEDEAILMAPILELSPGGEYLLIASADMNTGAPKPLVKELHVREEGTISAIHAAPLMLPFLPEEPPEEALVNVYKSPPGAPLANPGAEKLSFAETGSLAPPESEDTLLRAKLTEGLSSIGVVFRHQLDAPLTSSDTLVFVLNDALFDEQPPEEDLEFFAMLSAVVLSADDTSLLLDSDPLFEPAEVLKEVSLPIVAHADCEAAYPDHFDIPDNVICVGGEETNEGVCQGDSGGPLLVDDEGEWVQIGIASFSFGCARPGKPAAYVEVSAYLEFIDETMQGNSSADGLAPQPRQSVKALDRIFARWEESGADMGDEPGDGALKPQIVGGEDADIAEYPWMVSLQLVDPEAEVFIHGCGGTALDSEWILTAAHCVSFYIEEEDELLVLPPELISVLYGTSDSQNDGGERVAVAEIVLHPAWQGVVFEDGAIQLAHDVALLRLAEGTGLPAVTLAKEEDAHMTEPGVAATAIGWGSILER